MLNSIRRFLSPPTFGDADKDRIARLSTLLLQFMFVALLAGQLLSALVTPTPSFDIPLMFISCIAIAASYVILRRGRLRAAGFLAALFMWGMFTVISALYQGVLGYFPAGYVLCILFASSTLGVRTGVFFAALSSVSTLGLLFAETNGVLTPEMVTTPGLIDWLLLSLLFGMVVVVVTIVNQSLSTALQNARYSENEQERANRELIGMRASLEQRVAERTAQLNVSAEVAQAVSSILEPQELLSQVTRLIVERFSLHCAAVFLADEDNEFAVLVEATGQAGLTLKELGDRLEISGPSLVGTAIVTRRPCIAQDVNQEALRLANPLLTETQSEVALPLIVGEQVIGALDVQSTRLAAFDDEAVKMLQSLANQIAIALNNAQQYQQARLDARQASLLFEASQAAGSIGQGLDFAISRLFSVADQHSDFDNWMMGICDQENHSYTVKIAFAANEPAASTRIGQVVKIDQEPATPAILALLAGQMLVVNDPASDPQLDPLPTDQRAALGKLLSLPIKLGDRILGVLTLGRAPDKPDLGPRDIQLAQALASQLAIAIENHRLLEQAQKSVDELNHLMRLYMHEGWSNFTQNRAAAERREEYARLDAPPLRPEVLTQIDEVLRLVTTAGEVKPMDVDGQSVVSVPIELRGEVFGALTVQDTVDRRWTEDELATLRAVAAQVAQSLEAARLLEDSETSLQDTMVLYRTSRAVAAAQTPAEILHAITDAIAAPEVDQAVLVLIDVDNPAGDQVVEVIAMWERDNLAPEQAGARWINLQVPLMKHQSTEPMIFGDLAQAENIDPQSRHVLLNVIGAKGVALIPMIAGGRLLGWVMLESMQAPCRFTEQEIRRYRTLAGQAAVALENRRLFQDVQARVNELTILTRIGRRLASTLDLDEILASVIDESFNATKATLAASCYTTNMRTRWKCARCAASRQRSRGATPDT